MSQASVRLVDRVIIQVGASLGAIAGCEIVDLSQAQQDALKTAFAQPHGNVYLKLDGSVTFDPYVAPTPPPDSPDVATVKAYLADANLDTILGVADGALTPAQRDYAIKNGIRALRALTRIVRGIAT